jgi:hypothetical protein
MVMMTFTLGLRLNGIKASPQLGLLVVAMKVDDAHEETMRRPAPHEEHRSRR